MTRETTEREKARFLLILAIGALSDALYKNERMGDDDALGLMVLRGGAEGTCSILSDIREEESMTREATTKLLEMVEEGVLDKDGVILACVNYMSEDEVADMCHANEFFFDDEDEEESDD